MPTADDFVEVTTPAKAKRHAKSLTNGVSELSKGASVLTDGLLDMKRRLGLN